MGCCKSCMNGDESGSPTERTKLISESSTSESIASSVSGSGVHISQTDEKPELNGLSQNSQEASSEYRPVTNLPSNNKLPQVLPSKEPRLSNQQPPYSKEPRLSNQQPPYSKEPRLSNQQPPQTTYSTENGPPPDASPIVSGRSPKKKKPPSVSPKPKRPHLTTPYQPLISPQTPHPDLQSEGSSSFKEPTHDSTLRHIHRPKGPKGRRLPSKFSS